jgi:small subunit ribosomal protein S6
MSQRYEMMYILRPDLAEEQVQQEINKYRDFLNEYKAEELQIKIWGKRRLAYPIKRFLDGIYVQINYTADGKQVAPLERAMRLSDEVIRYLTLKLSDRQPAVQKSQFDEDEIKAPAPVSADLRRQPIAQKPQVDEPLPEVAAPRSYEIEN